MKIMYFMVGRSAYIRFCEFLYYSVLFYLRNIVN